MQILPSSSSSSSIFHACIIQPTLRSSKEDPVEYLTKEIIPLMREAATKNNSKTNKMNDRINLFILPELCPIGYSEETFVEYLPTTKQNKLLLIEIDELLKETAINLDSAICYGTIGWNGKENDTKNDATTTTTTDNHVDGKKQQQQKQNPSYYIRQNVINNVGNQIASYDKIHLCNYGDCAETRFFKSGSNVISFEWRGWKFGLLICADMRYPILSQKLTKPPHNVDVIIQPSCFARDISFRTWKSFRETRAVENSVYWLGCNYAGTNFGESSFVPPWVDEDHEPIVLNTSVGYLICKLDCAILHHARTELPFHKNLMSN